MAPTEPTRTRSMPDSEARPPAKRCRSSTCAAVSPSYSFCTTTVDCTAPSLTSVNVSRFDFPPTVTTDVNKLPPPPRSCNIPPDLSLSTVTTPNNDVCDTAMTTEMNMTTTTATITCTPELPDEVLVSVLRFVRHAGVLWRLRWVCRRWRRVIDTNCSVWKDASFKGMLFTRPVVLAQKSKLALGPRVGRAAIQHAAKFGNEWAIFLNRCLFQRDTAQLQALTIAQPVASSLVSGTESFDTRESAPNGWVVVHAARRGPADLPRGALVGMVRVDGGHQVDGNWRWHIDRHIRLAKPLRCAGYVGLWPLSTHLTELLIRGLHIQ